jgi:hypothetical protein
MFFWQPGPSSFVAPDEIIPKLVISATDKRKQDTREGKQKYKVCNKNSEKDIKPSKWDLQ